MPATGNLLPPQPVPVLSLPLAGSRRLSDQKPKHFAMMVFHRGMHWSHCRDDHGHLETPHAAFNDAGVTPSGIIWPAACGVVEF